MKRGWRNDPAWIAHYEKRDLERSQREITRMEYEVRQAELQANTDAAFRRMKFRPFSSVGSEWT